MTLTFKELFMFIDHEHMPDKRASAVFKTLYPTLLALWKSYPASLEGRHLTDMEALLCLATSLYVIRMMQETLDPSSPQPPEEEFPPYAFN